jgi:hypothetical protein
MAISLVVANHAHISTGLHGGLNGLLFVSGIAMATFAFNDTTNQTLRYFRNFALRLAIPAFILALIWAVAYWEFNWSELGFFRNWITIRRLVSFPIWYPQVIIQMLIVMGVFFWILDLTPKIKRHPRTLISVILAIAIICNLLSYAFWEHFLFAR